MTIRVKTPSATAAHKTSHENGGTDEISVAGLSGALADPQVPVAHVSRHESGGDDEIDVGGLHGVLADPQPPQVGGGPGTACEDDDPRLSDARPPDINGLTAETAPATADTVPVYDDSAGANRKVALGELRALMAEHVAQVRLQRTSSTGVQLLSFGGGLIEVNGEIVDVGAGKLCQTSDNLIDGTGANAGAAMGASTIYYLYISNSLASYQPGQLKASTTVPTGLASGSALGSAVHPDDFYLGTSGNARHWRFVGMARTNGSTQIVDSTTQRFVASYYNRLGRDLITVPAYSDGNSQTSYTLSNTTWARINGGTGDTLEWLSFGDEAVEFDGQCYSNNTGAQVNSVGIAFDSTTSPRVEGILYPANVAACSTPVAHKYTPTLGYHYACLMSKTTGGTMTVVVDSARSGASADPYVTFLEGLVRC